MTIEVADVPAESRYEARLGGEPVGFAAYTLEPAMITFTHTEVAAAVSGQGIGGQLARAALDDARRRDLQVRARCPFIRGWIERHPAYRDLLAGP